MYEITGDHGGLRNGPPQFQTIRDLLIWWENSLQAGPDTPPNKRVIFVKDMHPRVLELLGVLFEIPPEFFWPIARSFNSQVLEQQGGDDCGSSYWKVPVPRSYLSPNRWSITVPAEGKHEYRLGYINRGWGDDIPWKNINLSSFISYWGKRHRQNSWTGMSLNA
jgi:hypothetical protein